MFLLAKQIKKIHSYKKKDDLYTNNVEKINPIGIIKQMETNKIQINSENVYNTYN